MSGQNYFPNFVKADDILFGNKSYNIEVSDGQNPPGEFYPASYLPVQYSEQKLGGSWYVLAPGKVVALDSNGKLISAGLGQDFVDFKAAYEGAVGGQELVDARAAASIEYSANDAAYGIYNSEGALAVAGEHVAESMYSGGSGGVSVTDPVGIIRYAALTAPGSDPSNPSTFYRHSYDTGGTRAFSRWCYVQVPILEVGERTEVAVIGSSNYRMQVWPVAAPTIATLTYVAGGLAKLPATPGDGIATHFVVLGRTILFNGKLGAAKNVVYTPVASTPFMTLQTTPNPSGLIGQDVTFDKGSNFKLAAGVTDPNGYGKIVGKILDVRVGQSDDFKLVRTLFRDMGQTFEQPGSATDGRRTTLAIANAPKYIARIAVNFQSSYVTVPAA